MLKLKKTTEDSKLRKHLSGIVLILTLIIAFVLRLYRIDNPVADWHSWRQADTSAVTRNFEKFGFDFLHPRFDDLSNIASGKDNPSGFRFVEFPLYNAISFILYKLFIQIDFSIEKWERFVSIFSSLVSIYLIFLICRRYLNTKIAHFSAFFLSVLPFNIYYSRVILPEPMMIMFSLLAIYFFEKSFWLSSFFAALALLLKPFAIFLLMPLIYLWFRRGDFSRKRVIELLVYWVITFLPLGLWRLWMSQYPEGIPAWRWLLNGDGIRFKGAFFYWLFAERLAKLILGYWGLPLLFLGILSKPQKREGWFFRWWGVAMLLYVSVFATGNVKHDYYQIITVPIICVFLAKGTHFLITEGKKIFNYLLCYLFFVLCILFMLAFSWYKVRTFYWINKPEIVEAGRLADKILPKDAKVIAPYGGDTAFLYQTNRQGWPIGFEIEEKIKKGATHYVTISPRDSEAQELMKSYKVLILTSKYAIIEF